MEIFVDRRTDLCARIPFDTSIEVKYEGVEGPIEVDCINLSTGGVSIRSAVLAEPGTTTYCSFWSAMQETNIGVWGKVVWVHNCGDRDGEIGICFQGLSTHQKSAIFGLISERVEPIGPKESEETSPVIAKLLLDGTSSPIETHVLQREGNCVTFVQELELLQLERGLLAYESDNDTYRGRIEAVELQVDGYTPKLLITMRQESVYADDIAESQVQSEKAIQPNISQRLEGLGPEAEPTVEEIEWQPAAATHQTRSEEEYQTEDPLHHCSEPERKRSAPEPAGLFQLPEDDLPEEWPQSRAQHIRDKGQALSQSGKRAIITFLLFAWSHIKPTLLGLLRTAGSVIGGISVGSTSQLKKAFIQKLFPLIKTAFTFLLGIRPFKRIRRTTAVSSGYAHSGNLSGQNQNRVRKNGMLRSIALFAAAVLGTGLAVYGFAPIDDGNRIPLHRKVSVDSPIEKAVPLTPTDEVEKENSIDTPAIDPKDDPHTRENRDRTLMAVSNDHKLSTTRNQQPVTQEKILNLPAQKENPKVPSFGSKNVLNGQHYTIRMSKNVKELRGIPDKGGFTVIIPGSLSFDRAGPIAKAHPLVRRSMILNRGDHSALTIRFRNGVTPSYRVAANGASLEITIAESS